MQESKLLNTILQAYQLREQNQHVSAVKLAKSCLDQLPQNPEVQCLWGLLQSDEKQFQAATKAINTAISINPSKADYYFFLGEIQLSQKKYHLAETAYKQCVKRNDNHYVAHARLAKALDKQNNLTLAIKHYTRATEINPKYFTAMFNLGELYNRTNDRLTALVYFNKALELNPNHVLTLSNLGGTLFYENQYELALKFLHKAIAIEPNHPNVLNNLAAIYLESKEYDKALPFVRRLQKLSNGYLQSWWYLALCKTFVDKEDPDILQMLELLKENETTAEKFHLYFALGKAYHDCREYKTAFAYYEKANNVINKKHPYNLSAFKTNISKIINNHNVSKIKRMHLSDDNAFQPLFIVGMSRSGKSLLEKALSQHSKIDMAWELGISRVIESEPFEPKPAGSYPYWLKTMSKDEAVALKEAYFERLSRDIKGKPKYIVDTLPTNFLYVGLIKWLFPNAKIIHCVREPIDACLAMYFKYYSNSNYFTYNQEILAGYYLQYQRLMSFWSDNFEDPYLTVQYEDFVTNPQSILKTVYQYLGLRSPKSSCIEHLHHDEINKWQHYKFYLKPLIKGLEFHHQEPKEKEILFDKNQYDLANHYLQQGQYRRGIKLLKHMVKEEPNNASLVHLLGKLYLAEHNLEDAESVLRQAIAIDPNYFVSYFDLSQCLIALDNKMEAEVMQAKGKDLYYKSLNLDVDLGADEKSVLWDALNMKADIVCEFEKKAVVRAQLDPQLKTDSFMTRSWDTYFSDLSFGRYRDVVQNNEKRWYMRAWHFLFKNIALVDELMKHKQEKLFVLDIGCSSGYLRRFLEGNMDANTKPKMYYWGLDIREVNLMAAAKDIDDIESGASGNTIPSLYVVHDVKYSLPFVDDHFDVIVNFEMIKYLPIEQGKALFKEIARVLKPNGQLFFSTTYNSNHPGYMESVPYEQLEIMLKQTGFQIYSRRGSQASIYNLSKQIRKPHAPLVQDLLKVHPPEIVGAMITPLYPHLSSQVTFYCRKKT